MPWRKSTAPDIFVDQNLKHQGLPVVIFDPGDPGDPGKPDRRSVQSFIRSGIIELHVFCCLKSDFELVQFPEDSIAFFHSNSIHSILF